MASIRTVHFRNSYIYHIFNRGVERRNLFLSSRDRERFIMLLEYYRFAKNPKSFSHYLNLPLQERKRFQNSLHTLPQAVDILSYCLMPNHFHLLVRQNTNHGIIQTVSNIANSYAKYFNIKQKRVGPLFQGPFKAVLIESDEQLIHVSRYIHLNPVISGIIDEKELCKYPWSSLPTYAESNQSNWVEVKTVLSHFHTRDSYRVFIQDQIKYGKELDKIKHLIIEEV